jgi:hypothetical protein
MIDLSIKFIPSKNINRTFNPYKRDIKNINKDSYRRFIGDIGINKKAVTAKL